MNFLKQNRSFLLLAVAALALSACGGTGSSNSDSSQAVLSVSPSPAVVDAGGSITLTATGGTAPYNFVMLSPSVYGQVVVTSTTTALFYASSQTGTVQLEVIDANSNSSVFYVTIDTASGSGSGGLSISPVDTSVALDGYVTFTASGGTPPYTYTASDGYFSGATYYAPNVSETVTVEVSDAAGDTAETYVYVGTSAGAATSCEGVYTATIGGLSATISLVEDSSGNIGGYVYMEDYYFPVMGTCSASSGTGTISFNNLVFGSTYSGTVTISGTQVSMSGTLLQGGASYAWTATSQSVPTTTSTNTTTCEGNYTATIDATSGSLAIVSDGSDNVAGVLLLDGYYYVLSGTCEVSGSVDLTNETTGSTYTGLVTGNGTTNSMTGTFTTTGGSSYSWSASN